MKKGLQYILIFLAMCFLAGRSDAAGADTSGLTYLTELNIRAGYHFFNESSSWINSKETLFNEDFFRRHEQTADLIYSDNVDTNISSIRMGMPMITLEYITGLSLHNFPLIKKIKSLRRFRGIRMGAALTFYPFSKTEKNYYSGDIIFQNPGGDPTEPAAFTITNGEVSMEEKSLMIIPTINFYYYHERGFGFNAVKIIPFGGVEVGMPILNGERRARLTGDPALVAPGVTYSVDASIQETWFNEVGVRTGACAGVQIYLGGANYLELRGGFIYQETSIGLQRSGTWNDDKNGISYSRDVAVSNRSAVFSQTGFYITLGYTVGLK